MSSPLTVESNETCGRETSTQTSITVVSVADETPATRIQRKLAELEDAALFSPPAASEAVVPHPTTSSTKKLSLGGVPGDQCLCPCGQKFSRPDGVRRHRSLNICVAGINGPGVRKRAINAAPKKVPSSPEPKMLPLPFVSTSSTTTSSKHDSLSDQSNERSVSPSSTTSKSSKICPCGKAFSRPDGMQRHRRLNICSAGIPPTLEELAAARSKEEAAQRAKEKAQALRAAKRQTKTATHAVKSETPETQEEGESSSGENHNPVVNTCPCGRSFSRYDNLQRHRRFNICIGGITSLRHEEIPSSSVLSSDPADCNLPEGTYGSIDLDGTNRRRSSRVRRRPERAATEDADSIPSSKKRKRTESHAGRGMRGPLIKPKNAARKHVPIMLERDDIESEDEP